MADVEALHRLARAFRTAADRIERKTATQTGRLAELSHYWMHRYRAFAADCERKAMSSLVPAEDIEQIVGARRHSVKHLGRAVSAEQTMYVLHSTLCVNTNTDLRECSFSIALDRGGIWLPIWEKYQDRTIVLAVTTTGILLPDDIASKQETVSAWPDTSEPIEYITEEEDR